MILRQTQNQQCNENPQVEALLAALRSGDVSPVEALEAFQAKALVVDRF